MKKKSHSRLMILGICLVVFVAIILLQNQLPKLFPKQYQPVINDMKKEEVSSLEIQDGTKSNVIYLKNKVWYIKKDNKEFVAENARINTILESIFALKKEDPLSTNKSKHQEFGIGKKYVAVKGRDKSHKVYIGDVYNVSNNYVRVDNDSHIYAGSGLEDIFYPDDYRDLTVKLINDENNVSLAEISYNDTSIILEKRKEEWFANSTKVKRERVDYFTNELRTLKADDILSNDVLSSNEFEKQLTIRVVEDRADKTAEFYRVDEETYYVAYTGSDSVYKLKAGLVESLKKDLTDFTE